MRTTFCSRDFSDRLMSLFTREERKEHNLDLRRVNNLVVDFELGLADVVKKYGSVTIKDFGRFHQIHYKAPPRYIKRERVSINFQKHPWYQFTRTNYDEDEVK